MTRKRWLILPLALLAGAAATRGPALADSVQSRLTQARGARDAAVRTLHESEQRLSILRAQYDGAQAALDLAARDVLVIYRQKLALSAELAEAQDVVDDRARAAYELGPGAAIELFLGSQTPEDYASLQEYAAHAIDADAASVARAASLQGSLDGATKSLERRQADLAAASHSLETLAFQMTAEVNRARAAAAKANLSVKSLEQQLAALNQDQAANFARLDALVHAERGVDQSALLALLGPTGGRGCEIPSGLRETSQHLSGVSSWYGLGFAGNPTSTGAIYDPRLFTAANKELPLNVYLRVHYQGRCAIVLVNDRGPFIEGRTFDLSRAAAEYLGVGVSYVTADVLVPR